MSNADRESVRRGVDVGATHLALVVSDLERSMAFYARYAGMQVVHRRHDPGGRPARDDGQQSGAKGDGGARLGMRRLEEPGRPATRGCGGHDRQCGPCP